MTAPLSREQACEAYLAKVGTHFVTPHTQADFLSGWSARDAEVERLRAAINLAIKSLQWSLELAPTKKAEQSIEADIKQLQAALAGEGTK